ncbi:SpoIIE family protein phosphatase [Jatrophihabitans telluris]|uniref:SpoIIE family protein phosphatase n=1 Tax=Jatrophihabitans telluris TaxID=2038343 RepID=A0ABY4QYF4_9ACTN|nr:SpoIIE family protein phosphatase [Jatrophihabitans telluris]UQX88454.1 SpoIIE family protein phosphatase [Jatrophihabitans telluris]
MTITEWDDAACALLVLDPNRHVTQANALAARWTGYPAAALVGRPLSSLFTVGGRIYLETHFTPLLLLEGQVSELAVELAGADGSRMPVLLNARQSPDDPGRTHVAMVAATDRIRYERDLLHARLTAEEATAESLRLQARLQLLAEASSTLSSSPTVESAVSAVAGELVARWCDWTMIYLCQAHPTSAPHSLRLAMARHRDAARTIEVAQLASDFPSQVSSSSALHALLTTGRPQLVAPITEERLSRAADDPAVGERLRSVGVRSAIWTQLMSNNLCLGALCAVRGEDGDPFDDGDLAAATDLGARIGGAVNALQLKQREQETSVALQRALLTPAMPVPGLDIVARYRPAAQHAQVGGDWYDSVARSNGEHLLVIGDVIGHGSDAAAAMGQLRSIIRTLAYTTGATPAELLSRADEAALGLGLTTLATCTVVSVRPGEGRRRLTWSNAGHPPPVTLTAGGTTELLAARPEPLLGLGRHVARSDHVAALDVGDTLLLYTDGLIERRDEDIDESLSKLARTLRDCAGLPLEQLGDTVLETLLGRSPDNADDVALLALRPVMTS